MKVVEIERIRPHFETRQNLQDHQRDDSLPVRRTFIDGSSSKLRLDRLDIFPFGCGEVVQRMQPAQAVEISDHVLGDCAAIECVQPFAADRLQGFREFGLPLDRPYLRRPVPAQKGPPGGGIEFEEIALVGDVESDARGDCVTVARQIDGGRKERRQGKLAVICDQTRPGFDRAGDGHGVRRMTLDRLDAALSVPFGGRGRRRPSRAVVGDDVFRSAPAEQRETIPADSRRPRTRRRFGRRMRRRPRRRRFRRFSGSRRPSGSRCCGTWPPSHSCLRPSIGREVQNCAWLSSRFAGLHWGRGGFFPVRRKRSMKDRSRQTPGRRQQGSLLIYRLHRRQYMVPSIIGTPLDLRVEASVERGRGPRAAWWRGHAAKPTAAWELPAVGLARSIGRAEEVAPLRQASLFDDFPE